MADEKSIYDIAQEFRQDLLKQERAAAVRMTDIYGTAYGRISAQLKKLLEQIEAARAAGQAINPSWLLRQQRYAELLIQVEEQIGRFTEKADTIITNQQSAAIRSALKDSQSLMAAAADQGPAIGVSFNKINPAAVENLAGFLGNGSPLNALLKQLPADGRQVVERGLMNGIVQGRNPRAIASEIRQGMGGNLNRALTIARTETLRAYRETTHQTYQANADVLEGWIWLSARNSRSCAACLALHGTFHLLSERMASHVRCRCTTIPAIKGQPSPIEKGADWFEKQPAEFQKTILDRPGAYQAYRSGKLKLEDFVGRRDSVQWGSSYGVLSTRRALAGEGKFPGDAAKPLIIQPGRVVPKPVVQPTPKPAVTTALKSKPVPTPRPVPATEKAKPKVPSVPPLSPAVLAKIDAATIGSERIDVNKLGLPNNPLAPFPSGRLRKRKIEIDPSLITLSRDDLTKDRLLRLEKDLAGGVVPQKSFNIGVIADPANPGRYIVYGDGNHRVAYLQLVGYREPIPVELTEAVKPKAVKPPRLGQANNVKIVQ